MKIRYAIAALALSAQLSASTVFAGEAVASDALASIEHHWASINYQTPGDDREVAFKVLVRQAQQFAENNPGKAEPLVWQAIVLASYAKAEGGLGALSKAREARDLLLAAEKIDPNTLSGSIYTSLGSLYAKVPGWPIGFGDNKKARAYLETALKINPTGMDAHYFYGDFLADRGEYAKALEHLNLALAAPPRPTRLDADAGRRKDIEALIAEIRAKHGDKLATK